jgi:hypothetical protein
MTGPHDERLVQWLRDQGLDPNQVYQVDIRMDGMTVYEYALDRGAKRYDPALDGPAVRTPYEVEW